MSLTRDAEEFVLVSLLINFDVDVQISLFLEFKGRVLLDILWLDVEIGVFPWGLEEAWLTWSDC